MLYLPSGKTEATRLNRTSTAAANVILQDRLVNTEGPTYMYTVSKKCKFPYFLRHKAIAGTPDNSGHISTKECNYFKLTVTSLP